MRCAINQLQNSYEEEQDFSEINESFEVSESKNEAEVSRRGSSPVSTKKRVSKAMSKSKPSTKSRNAPNEAGQRTFGPGQHTFADQQAVQKELMRLGVDFQS